MTIKNKTICLAAAGAVTISVATGCATVKEYQKSKINDAEMEPGSRKAEKPENNFMSYREGASGANGGKTGGGCGCN